MSHRVFSLDNSLGLIGQFNRRAFSLRPKGRNRPQILPAEMPESGGTNSSIKLSLYRMSLFDPKSLINGMQH